MPTKANFRSINDILIYVAICVSLVVFTVASFPQLGIEVGQNQILLLIVILVLLIFRHFGIIEIPGFLKLSREVEEVRRETREIRSALQSLALSQSTSSAHAVVNVQGMIDNVAEDARDVESEIPSIPSRAEISDQLGYDIRNVTQLIEHGQFVAAFATLRNRIESELREILRLRGEETGRASLFRLMRRAEKTGIIEPPVSDAISVVNNAANTILHSAPYQERIPMEKARYISELGIKTLYELRRIRNGIDQT